MCKCTTIPHPIPGEKLPSNHFDHHLFINEIQDPNNTFSDTLTPTGDREPVPRHPNSIEEAFGTLYDMGSSDDNVTNIILEPTVGSIYNPIDKNIYTKIYVFENFKEKLEESEFEIYQNFSMGIDGTYQLGYYVCFNRSKERRVTGNIYRQHKFSIKSTPVYYTPFNLIQDTNGPTTLEMRCIEKVMTCVINVNPKTSRGTVTTVTQPTNDDDL